MSVDKGLTLSINAFQLQKYLFLDEWNSFKCFDFYSESQIRNGQNKNSVSELHYKKNM